MSLHGKSFLSSAQLNSDDIEAIFGRTELFKSEFKKSGTLAHLLRGRDLSQRVLGMVFCEPSTRTRLSFHMAAIRLGMRPLSLDTMSVSSVQKGETFSDTIRNFAAMSPDVMIVRYGNDVEADAAVEKLNVPVVSGGIGTAEHPTQALLDAFTIREFRGRLQGERLLLVGDVRHSRVANSNLILMNNIGVEVGYCAPPELHPADEGWSKAKRFDDLNEGIKWATAVMGLRIQKERHAVSPDIGLSIAEYRQKYRIGTDNLNGLISDGILMHPGPVIRGVEFSEHVLHDPRCKVTDQVTNGVFVRAALLSLILGIEVSAK